METNKEKRVRISSEGHSAVGSNSCTITGLSHKELELIIGMVNSGAHWITTDNNGRLRTHPRREPLPSPVQDKEMLPFWSSRKQKEFFIKRDLINFDEKFGEHLYASIYITSLCGYNYTPEFYKETAEKLEGFGFECMRSRRGSDGRFWEVWFLPGVFCAKGALADFLSEKKENEKLPQAIEFLRGNVSFGSMDVSVQRCCMVMGD